jgi:hypothetical protein
MIPGPTPEEDILDIDEAAAFLGTTRKGMYRLNFLGLVTYYKSGTGARGGVCSYIRSDLRACKLQGRRASKAELAAEADKRLKKHARAS